MYGAKYTISANPWLFIVAFFIPYVKKLYFKLIIKFNYILLYRLEEHVEHSFISFITMFYSLILNLMLKVCKIKNMIKFNNLEYPYNICDLYELSIYILIFIVYNLELILILLY